jgi:hypothetical protein
MNCVRLFVAIVVLVTDALEPPSLALSLGNNFQRTSRAPRRSIQPLSVFANRKDSATESSREYFVSEALFVREYRRFTVVVTVYPQSFLF